MLLDLAKDRAREIAVDDGTQQRSFAELLDRGQRVAHFLRHEAGLALYDGASQGCEARGPAEPERGARALFEDGHNVGLDGSEPHLITAPMYHTAAPRFAVYGNANGAPILIMPRWNEREALDLLVRREVIHVHFVPTMFVRLLRLPDAERRAFRAPRLSLALHGAAPISVPLKRRMIE